MLTAEVVPVGERRAAALALQRQGFKVLSIGETITIGGTPELFEKFFNMKMEKRSKDVLPGIPGPTYVEFYEPITPALIPEEFKSLIKEILFPEPPEYFKN